MTRTTLGPEVLEVRENPAVTVTSAAGVLTVTSDGASDIAKVNYSGLAVQVQQFVNGQWQPLPGAYWGISKIVFAGNGGNDQFTNETMIRLEADGGTGSDKIWGGSGDDVIKGGSGDDFLYGGKGNDTLYGQDGVDYLSDAIVTAGPFPGTVTISEGGNDKMYGGTGRDTIWAGSGDDYLDGGKDGALDTLWGQSGKDTFVVEPSGLDWPKDYNPVDDTVI